MSTVGGFFSEYIFRQRSVKHHENLISKNRCIYIYLYDSDGKMHLSEVLKTKKDLNNEEGAALNIMYTSYIIKTKAATLLRTFALTPEQYNVLRILKGSFPDKMCVKQIAERVVERSANIPRTIDKLVLKKLAKRNISPADKRESRIEISRTGIKLLQAVNPLMDKLMKDICNLNKTEMKELNKLLDRYRKD